MRTARVLVVATGWRAPRMLHIRHRRQRRFVTPRLIHRAEAAPCPRPRGRGRRVMARPLAGVRPRWRVDGGEAGTARPARVRVGRLLFVDGAARGGAGEAGLAEVPVAQVEEEDGADWRW